MNNIADILFYEELKDEDKPKFGKDISKVDLFFYYKNQLFNLSEFIVCGSGDYDGMNPYKDDKYIYIKYLDDDKIQIMVQ